MSDFASPLSYLVAERRRRDGELGFQVLDSRNEPLYPITVGCVREAFIADRETVLDHSEGELLPFATWHFHRRKR